MAVTRAQVVAQARTWLGTRWQHQGRVRGAGVDCAGLLVCVAQSLGLRVTDVPGYGRQPLGDTLRRLCEQQLVPVPLAALQPADVLLLRFNTEPQHLALVGDHPAGLSLLHAYAQARRVVEHRLDALWLGRAVAGYAFAELAEATA
jgi:hypothetical protein